MTQKEYHYYDKEEKVIEYKENKPGPELYAISRDKRNNPFFNLDPHNKSHWIGVAKWDRDKGLKTQYIMLRAWLKDIEKKAGKQIITHYAIEQRQEQEKNLYIFTFTDKDILEKNHKGAWAWINKPKRPEIYDGTN